MTEAADAASASGFRLTGSAPERYEQYVAPLMAPFVAVLVESAELRPGATVLDLACGTGFTARLAAARVGPTGRVHGSDVNPEMLKVAVAHRPHLYPDIEFAQAAADGLPYEDGAFDAVLCQQGAQFFPDLSAACAEAARVTAPGGHFAATTWSHLDRSPYFLAQRELVATYAGEEAAADFTRAFAVTGDVLAGALREAGFQEVAAVPVTLDVTLPPLTDYAPGHLSALPWSTLTGTEALRTVGPAFANRFADRTAPDGTVTLPFTATLTTAVR
ncbi:class I SAM-dependent methyltransferase [Streptomyces sp. VRA16 Mangrove soil]|uniref:class I SAM-dependent methyltransferase n=1 Tax=Streptomyces sp. VRA16 Mangrove soil TaxID=2817434 RepID=UPI001A9CF1DE|nr:methyltransferase domain-containing protein [Streptomyces sp. VRA16 Mangrove soil]MBO1338094.1 methyltransferase domain-containing protein [Streptomyces sp. VRA16 Mangrove soil]